MVPRPFRNLGLMSVRTQQFLKSKEVVFVVINQKESIDAAKQIRVRLWQCGWRSESQRENRPPQDGSPR